MRAFEIQTFMGGKWKIDSIFDDRELAVFEASRMDDSNRYAGVRVVEEIFDEETHKSIMRTIFRGGRVDIAVSRASSPAPPPPSMQPRAGRTGPRGGGGKGARSVAAKRPPKRQKSNTALIIALTVIMAAGIAAMTVLHFLPRFV